MHDISIHALRVEGDTFDRLRALGGELISIHALRVEGDNTQVKIFRYVTISIHALRVEGDNR